MTKVKYFKENSILHGLESKKILCIEIILDFFYDGFGSNKPGEWIFFVGYLKSVNLLINDNQYRFYNRYIKSKTKCV